MALLTDEERERRKPLLNRINNPKMKSYIENTYGTTPKRESFEAAYYPLKRWDEHTKYIFSPITVDIVDSYLSHLKNEPNPRTKRKMSALTIFQYLRYLKRYFKDYPEPILEQHTKELMKKNGFLPANNKLNVKDVQNLYHYGRPKVKFTMDLLLLYDLEVQELTQVIEKDKSFFVKQPQNSPLNLTKLDFSKDPLTERHAVSIKKRRSKNGNVRFLGSKESLREYFETERTRILNKYKIEIPKIRLVNLKNFADSRPREEIENIIKNAEKNPATAFKQLVG